ncbi:MAG: DUF1345 domain-containing protein [Rhizobiales bacterium]|nr:DUF1345 domain-containing protein [Hyphomicrobiales bacterium]
MAASKTHAKPVRIVRAHIKLFAAAALGIVLYFLLPGDLHVGTRMLIAWNAAVFLYLVVAALVIVRFELSRARQRAAAEDEGAVLILILTVAAAAASLAAIFVELNAQPGQKVGALPATLALSTVVLSWVFIHVIFAFHYAHEFYGDRQHGHKGGLHFPEDDRPDYWDFVYFSFVIGVAGQVSDVQVTTKSLRRLVIAHGAFSFFYNVAVIALIVNIAGEFIN